MAPEVTSVPSPADIDRVAAFTHEPFVCEGEDAADVLAPGTIRRHAFEFALGELNAGASVPTQKWRRRWSLLLGLDRALHTETPTLADGTTLNPHQIDALSGTYAALLADAQRRARGGDTSDGDALLLSFEDEEPTEVEEPPPAGLPAEPDPDEPDEDAEPDEDLDDEDRDADDEPAPSLEDELEELPESEPEPESASYDDEAEEDVDEDIDAAALNDPNAHKRFWFEHATGAGKTVAAMGFVEACRTGGILILTHRRNLVDQFIDELQTRGYGARLCKPLLGDADIDTGGFDPSAGGPVTIETYQWFVRNAGQISGAYTVVICDEAHTALGDKTSAAIRAWTGPIFIGMTATGALIARHVTDLFPTQTSRFDLAQAARRGVIAPLRCLRIPPGPGVRTIAKVPLRKGEVDMEFDQDELAKLLDHVPFNLAIADLYKTRFRNTPGVVYAAGVQHAYNVAESFRAVGIKAQAVSGETPKRELAKILAEYEAGEVDVLVNAQLLAEGWNSPRATICMHLAPTASKRIYQQRVGRVTRRHPGKEAGVVIDFVHPATTNDDPVVTLHSLLDRDVYRGGAIVVGPVRRGRGRRVKVERRVLPVTPDIERRRQVFERELWRIAVEQLDWGEQRVWAALSGAKASPANWRRARAMLNFDRSGELRRQFLITALERNRNPQLRMRAIQEIAVLREAEPFDTAIDHVGQWPRDERREASRVLLQAMADRRIGRRDQATAWIWRLAEYTRDLHEEYAAQRWPATKHLLGLLVNSSGAAHARNARRLVHGARQHDRRLQAALLAAAVAHTPEAEEVLREARTRLARKPGALSRDLLKDFPSGKRRKKRSRKKKGGAQEGQAPETVAAEGTAVEGAEAEGGVAVAVAPEGGEGAAAQGGGSGRSRSRRSRSRSRSRRRAAAQAEAAAQATTEGEGSGTVVVSVPVGEDEPRPAAAQPDAPAEPADDAPRPARRRRGAAAAAPDGPTAADAPGEASDAGAPAPDVAAEAPAEDAPATPTRRRATRKVAASADADAGADTAPAPAAEDAPATPARRRTTRKVAAAEPASTDAVAAEAAEEAPKPPTRRRTAKKPADAGVPADAGADAAQAPAAEEAPKPPTRRRAAKKADDVAVDAASAEAAVQAPTTEEAPKTPARRRTTKKAAATPEADAAAGPAADAAPKTPTRRRTTTKAADAEAPAAEEAPKTPARRRTTKKAADAEAPAAEEAPKPARRRTTTKAEAADAATDEAPKTPARRRTTKQAADAPAADDAPKTPTRRRTTKQAADAPASAEEAPKTPARRRTTKAAAADAPADEAPKAPARRRTAKPADAADGAPKAPARRRTATKAAQTSPAATADDPVEAAATTAKRTARKAAGTAAKAASAAAKGTSTAAKRTTAAAKRAAAAATPPASDPDDGESA
ncbi:DEAD/DEAH box helicase family protein [Patulibacter sp. SYSU D01012]|uniref:DEAD/DEAH box helicase n=1 Tax=Patulibacter sp. SYSU D01012 TaxID=2817381 RepID=UPI001B304CF8